MIKMINLAMQRGSQKLLTGANADIFPGQRVAIVGANGAGKSSLFQLILGKLQPEEGSVQLPGGWRIAHMAQEVSDSNRCAVDYVLDGDQHLRRIEADLKTAGAAGDDARLAVLHGEWDSIRGYEAKTVAEQLLHGLGFNQVDVSRNVSEFSGGWRIRLNLAQALMAPSDLLLLDEPTNHLDLDATLWLEGWLKKYPGTLLFISHDRDFIDSVATHVMHFEQGQLNLYTGGYSFFERARSERLAQQQASYEKQQQRIAEIENFVRRFKAKASKAKQAQSRIKELERMEKIAAAHVDSPFHFEFPASDKISSPLLNLSKVSAGYGDKTVLEGVNLSILPGTRIGLLGPNGAGKSTLIKTLVGDIPVLDGVRSTGENLAIGYFAQHQLEALDLNASPALHLQRLSPTTTEQSIRNFLGGFGFSGDAALGDIKRFSGGEKARLALAIIAWQKPNLLLLDEPTNHLDLEMRHALTVALQGFEGAVIVVSHDRHLLKNTVEEFLLVVDGKVENFDGDLVSYEKWLIEHQRETAKKDKPVQDKPSTGESAEDRKERKRQEAERRKQASPVRRQIEKVEARMAALQDRLAELDESLSQPDIYEDSAKVRLKTLLQEQAEGKSELEELELEWFELTETLEQLLA